MNKHKRIIGILFLSLGGLFLLPFSGLFGVTTIPTTGEELASIILTIVAALLYLAAGYGYLTDLRWCESIAIPMGIFTLSTYPIGTVIGVYWAWFMYSSYRK